jgi:hypothetical protein
MTKNFQTEIRIFSGRYENRHLLKMTSASDMQSPSSGVPPALQGLGGRVCHSVALILAEDVNVGPCLP